MLWVDIFHAPDELAGFGEFQYLGLRQLGLGKGSCPVTEANISTGVQGAKGLLAIRQRQKNPSKR